MNSRAPLAMIGPVLAFAFLAPTTAPAADDDVVTEMSASRIERIVNSFREVRNFEELDNNLYVFEVDGTKILLQNSGNTLEVATIFTGKRVTLSRLNEWNLKMKFTKAFLDKNNNIHLQHSIELTGGVTEKNVKEWLKTYVLNLKLFKIHIED
jgi:hypothetical protein